MEELFKNIQLNQYQTPLTEDFLSQYPDEVQEQAFEFLTSIEFLKRLISPNRRYARDCPRDEKGRIIVDLTNPHICEDTDYFRQPAIHYLKHKCYTFLKPNSNPHSEYRKYWDEEIRRCREGYVRESDGEWVTGFCYWFLNYNPMLINEIQEGKKKAIRKEGFPYFFEGIYWRFHYLWQAREAGKHAIELAKRGVGKSYSLSSIMTHNLILGESEESKRRVTTVLTAYQKEYLKGDKDGTLSKFQPSLSFLSANTPFPRLMLKASPNEMSWRMGYLDEYNRECGSFNMVLAVSAKDDSGKLRGKRGWILFEEMGQFKNLDALYDVTRKSVEDGDYTFATMYLVGTASDNESDFSSAKKLLQSPEGHNILALENVFDKPKQGSKMFGFFYGACINRAGCCNKDGVSDVIKALFQVLMARYNAKYNNVDPQSLLRQIAEDPITPAEAIVKVKAAYFPVAQLNERILQIDSNPRFYDNVLTGDLVLNNGKVDFRPSNGEPIRKWGVDNDTPGCIEIFDLPEKDSEGNIPNTRYILGCDSYDNDQAESCSLYSIFVFDLFTDNIVAEYTGRTDYADDAHEIARKLCLLYNGRCMFEAHAYSEKVPTPSGWKTWESIKIGDILFSPTKGTVKVIDIPVDCEMPIYKVYLTDGRVITASDKHIWLVRRNNEEQLQELTTEQLMNKKLVYNSGGHQFFIPESGGVEYNYKELPIDPYTMGLILSEGCLVGCHCTKNQMQLSAGDEDAKFYIREVPYELKKIGSKGYSWSLHIPNCKQILRELGLLNKDSHNKFIPTDYLICNTVQRMKLLQGLMDGDGCAQTKGAPIYITTSKQLAQDIISLCRSLGMKAWLQTSREGVYRVAIATIHKIFGLPRKIVEQHVYKPFQKGSKASALLYKTAIDKIEFSHYEKGKCVTVDSEDGLYLINDYVVTHNSNKKGWYAYFAKMNSTHLLAETPQYLRDQQMIKYQAFGSNKYGINASAAINNYGNDLLRQWLISPRTAEIEGEDGKPFQTTIPTLYTIRNRALLDEAANFDGIHNFDRISAMAQVMLYRQEKIILYQGDMSRTVNNYEDKDYAGNDDFFTQNYDEKFNIDTRGNYYGWQ